MVIEGDIKKLEWVLKICYVYHNYFFIIGTVGQTISLHIVHILQLQA